MAKDTPSLTLSFSKPRPCPTTQHWIRIKFNFAIFIPLCLRVFHICIEPLALPTLRLSLVGYNLETSAPGQQLYPLTFFRWSEPIWVASSMGHVECSDIRWHRVRLLNIFFHLFFFDRFIMLDMTWHDGEGTHTHIHGTISH